MRFKRIYLEITNRCNLSCEFCLPHQRPLDTMSEADFRHLIKEIKPLSNFVYFHVKGEPLLHPQLALLLDICQEEGLLVNLTTNGTLLSQQQSMLLKKSALRQVNISIHSFNQQSPIGQKAYLAQVLNFASAASKQGKIYVSLRLWNQQNGQLDQTSKELLTQITTYFQHQQEGLTHSKLIGNVPLAERVFLSFDDRFVWPSLNSPFLGTEGTCYGLRNQLAILVDGTVSPCCLDGSGEISLGNALETPLAEILTTTHSLKIVQGFQQGKVIPKLCQHCSYRLRFKR